jgi:hypothetical protein
MATLESFFASDEDAELNGKWVSIGPFQVKLARAHFRANPKYAKANAERWKPHLRDAELKTLDAKTEQRIAAEVLADAVVLDWKGVDGDDGHPLPCTKENVVAKLTALPEFFDRVVSAATHFENFKAAQREVASGNS